MRRSIRDYLLTLILGIVVFAIAAFFLLRAAEGLMLDVVDKIGSDGEEAPLTMEETATIEPSAPVNGEVAPEVKKDETLSFLVLVEDETETYADTIFLVGINATKKKATVALIPSNTVVPEGDKKHHLGDLYDTKSSNFYREFVEQETGVKANFYMSLSLSGLSNLIDFFGGLSYTVPEAMSSFDESTNFKVNLQAGKQTLTGDQVTQLITYRNFAGGTESRENAKIGFARAFTSAFLNENYLSRAKAVMYNINYHMDTDFEETDLNEVGGILFALQSYQTDFVRIPGAASGEFYAISTSRATSMFNEYH